MESLPLISVVIPSFNAKQTIKDCLQSLSSQISRYSYEILLIDSSTDGTDQIVNREFPEISMSHYDEKKLVGIARNIGIDQAKGDVILFIDTDCIAPPNWIEQMYQTMQDTCADGIGGSIINGTPFSITGTVGYYLEFFRFFPKHVLSRRRPTQKALFLVGANCGFKRKALENNRYYDSYEKNNVGEDFYFCWQLAQQGKELVFAPSIPVRHRNKTGLAKILHYQHKLGTGACYYRIKVSSKTMSVLKAIPYICLLFPLIVIPWIGCYAVKRMGIIEFIKFLLVLPLLYVGNFIWSIGFLKKLKKSTR